MIDSVYFWSTLFFMIIGTICIRGSIIAMSSKFKINDRMRELFSYFPAAIFPAFIVPSAFYHQGQSQIFAGKERLVIVAVAAFISLWLRSTIATIASGLVALYFLAQYS